MWAFKNKDKQEFRFVIDDTFALKNGDAVLTGEVVSGQIREGDPVLYTGPDGEPGFRCVVAGMEQPPNRVKIAKAGNGGRLGSHYGLLIQGHGKEEFAVGGCLTAERA